MLTTCVWLTHVIAPFFLLLPAGEEPVVVDRDEENIATRRVSERRKPDRVPRFTVRPKTVKTTTSTTPSPPLNEAIDISNYCMNCLCEVSHFPPFSFHSWGRLLRRQTKGWCRLHTHTRHRISERNRRYQCDDEKRAKYQKAFLLPVIIDELLNWHNFFFLSILVVFFFFSFSNVTFLFLLLPCITLLSCRLTAVTRRFRVMKSPHQIAQRVVPSSWTTITGWMLPHLCIGDQRLPLSSVQMIARVLNQLSAGTCPSGRMIVMLMDSLIAWIMQSCIDWDPSIATRKAFMIRCTFKNSKTALALKQTDHKSDNPVRITFFCSNHFILIFFLCLSRIPAKLCHSFALLSFCPEVCISSLSFFINLYHMWSFLFFPAQSLNIRMSSPV